MTHDVFRVPELLSLIFRHLSAKELCSILTVNRDFSSVGIPIAWEEVTDFCRVLVALSPLLSYKYNSSPFKFSTPPRLADFHRTSRRYFSFVRTLDFLSSARLFPILNELARARPRDFILFPNLKSFRFDLIDKGTDFSRMFLHDSITHLRMDTFCMTKDDLCSVFDSITEQTTQLSHLDFNSARLGLIDDGIAARLEPVVQHCHLLKEITLPHGLYTSQIHASLAVLSRLTSLRIYCENPERWRPEIEDDPIVPVTGPVFPALRHLQCLVKPEDLEFQLSALYPIHQLTSLEVATSYAHRINLSCLDNCNDLTALTLVFLRHRLGEGDQINIGITIEHLKPTFSSLAIKRLRRLTLEHPFPFRLSLEDFEWISQQLSKDIEHLALNPSPEWFDEGNFEFICWEALIPLVRNCPRLRTLEVYVTGPDVPLDMNMTGVVPSQHLEKFTLGTDDDSSIDPPEPHAIAIFLSHVCPPSCRVEMPLNPDVAETVNKLLPSMSRARLRTDARIQALEQEVALLRQLQVKK